jgi:hypothetical protein
MKIEYKIVDNFLPKKEFKIIKDLFFSDILPWFYQANGVSRPQKLSKDGSYFTHLFFSFEKDKIGISNYYQYIAPIVSRLDIGSMTRVKGNLYQRTNTIYEHDKHQDYNFKHKGFIYYVNTNNGFTKLLDGTKIESIENRGLFFDPSMSHNSSTCTDADSRININFNYF